MSATNDGETRILNQVFKNDAYDYSADATWYVSLHTGDPGITGASEAAGGSYARQLANASFAAAASGAKATNANIDFAVMPAATITHVGIWDAVSGGNFLEGGPLAASKTTNAGDTFRLTSGALIASLT